MIMKKSRKGLAKVMLGVFLIFQFLLPSAALAMSIGTQVMPYERVAAKSGSWQTDRVQMGQQTSLTIGYKEGGLNQANTGVIGGTDTAITTRLREDLVLTSIYLPYSEGMQENIRVSIADDKGTLVGDFPAVRQSMGEGAKGLGDVFVLSPESDVVLTQGNYIISSSEPGLTEAGDFLIKGMNQEGVERIREQPVTMGNENFADANLQKFDGAKADAGAALAAEQRKPIAFLLEENSQLDEILINSYNDGAGAPAGTVRIDNASGAVVWQGQAQGGSLGDTPNGFWAVYPGIVLEAGSYLVTVSDPSMLSYDAEGDPLFYVSISDPVVYRTDFTGTYRIDLDTIKTRTLMGPVSGGASAFSLRDFELTVLDKDGFVELIGMYEGMPFSQNCKVIEETEDTLKAQFAFGADLTRLPYKAKVSAEGIVTLTKSGTRGANISIEGQAFYSRAESKDQGADENEYSLTVQGRRVTQDLPPFVATALGKANGGGGAGNIPGPGGSAQAAVGILFPPLVGVVVNVIQETIRAREAAKAAAKRGARRDKAWYKNKYPNASDETIAMIMLADAMGNTDEPDEGDAVSVGDNEKGGSSGPGSGGEEGYESDSYESDSYESEDGYEGDGEEYGSGSSIESDDVGYEDSRQPEELKEPEAETQASSEELPKEPELPGEPEEPETMVVKTSHRGAETLLVKDKETGQWVNAETGNPFDLEKHQRNSEADFAQHMNAAEEERWKAENRVTAQDQINDEKMADIKRNYEWEQYKDRMQDKYGTKDMKEIERIVAEKQQRDMASFNKWQTIGNINEGLEIGAKVVGVAADVTIDGLAPIVPGGTKVRALYKFTKGVAGTVADKGVYTPDGKGWNTGAFVEGAIKGGTDAGLDYIENPYVKAVVAATGETAGSAAGAAIRGGNEDWTLAAKQGFVDGVGKAGMGLVGDGLTGNMPGVTLPKGASVHITTTTKNVLKNTGSLTKLALGATDEFGVKPFVGDPAKEALKIAHEAGLKVKK